MAGLRRFSNILGLFEDFHRTRRAGFQPSNAAARRDAERSRDVLTSRVQRQPNPRAPSRTGPASTATSRRAGPALAQKSEVKEVPQRPMRARARFVPEVGSECDIIAIMIEHSEYKK
jgi:hypothetical protein